jgi:ankyrin repeat protein
MRAAKSGETAIVKLLLDAGADPKATLANGNNALMFASGLGWRDGSPAAPSYDQGSPDDAVATIELLLTTGLDINGTNTNGDTPLHSAVSGRAAPEIVRALIQHGAKLDIQNKRGQTPLALASASRGTKDLSAIAEILKAAASRP